MKICFLILSLFFSYEKLSGLSFEDTLKQANESYQKGEQAQTLLEREVAFNQALTLYSKLENSSSSPSAQLYQAIANSYFQLGEYAWSILYNQKAMKLDPGNSQIIDHLALARTKLGLEPHEKLYTAWQQLLLEPFFSFGGRLELLFWSFILAFVFLVSFIWLRTPFIKTISLVLSAFSLLLIFNLLLNFYFSSLEGILVTSTGFYREPDLQQAQLTSLPLRAGTKMRILASNAQGSWLKIANADGLVGYIPASAIRII